MPRKHIETPSAYNEPFPTAFRTLLNGEVGTRGKVSQQEVANFIGKTRQTVGYYADGTAKPDIDTIGKIADFFEVTVDYLLGRSDFTSARLRVGTFEDYGFSEAAVENIDRIHDINSFVKMDAYKADEGDRDAMLTGAAFDMLVRLLEDVQFIDFLRKASVYVTFHMRGGCVASGSVTDSKSGRDYSVNMGSDVLRDVFMMQALEPLKDALNDIEKEQMRKEAADNEQ